jgi:predicted nucleic acid-binding protein
LRLLFDAGSVINLANGRVLDLLASTDGYDGYAGQIVVGECGALEASLLRLEASGRFRLLPDLEISASDFAAVLRRHNLGAGEAECLLHALGADFVVSCDDRRARRVLGEELGSNRVTGSIGLLIRGVGAGLLSVGDAYASYLAMRACGGYLPALGYEEFVGLVS